MNKRDLVLLIATGALVIGSVFFAYYSSISTEHKIVVESKPRHNQESTKS